MGKAGVLASWAIVGQAFLDPRWTAEETGAGRRPENHL